MKFNLHTHTRRCGHAVGADEEYVLKAIEAGYEMIGFSDHSPYIFPDGYISGMRMTPDEAYEYAESIRSLKEKYKDKIDIKLGFELEWYPRLIDRNLEFLKTLDYDYLLLAQHHTDNENDRWCEYAGAKTNNIGVLDKYINQLLLGAKSGEFTYVCHPDLIYFVGNEEIYLRKMRYMIEELKKLEIPLELNFFGYFDKRQYPNRKFWEMVKEVGNPVVIGLDAHTPSVYTDSRINGLRKYAEELGLEPIDSIKLIGAEG